MEQLTRSIGPDPDDQFLGQLVMRESDRLSRILTEFLDFSRVQVTKFDQVDLHEIALGAVRLVREYPNCGAATAITIEGDATCLQGDGDLLHRVVFNLVLNAAQVINDSGQSGQVVVRIDRPNPKTLRLGRDFADPVRLRVSDNGPGIDAEIRPRLFEPFVSGRVGGTGLGLAIVQRAVLAHQGMIMVDSTPGQGTIFTVYLHASHKLEVNA